MYSSEHLTLVELPVRVEVVRKDGSAKEQDGLGALSAPAGAADAETPTDDVAAGSLDDAGRDGKTGADGLAVAHVRGELEHVPSAVVHGSPTIEAPKGSGAPHASSDLRRLRAGQERVHAFDDPVTSRIRAWGVEAVRCRPEVLDQVNQVGDDGDSHARFVRGVIDGADLILVPVEQDHPVPLPFGITRKRLAKAFCDDVPRGLRDAAEDALVEGTGSGRSSGAELGREA